MTDRQRNQIGKTVSHCACYACWRAIKYCYIEVYKWVHDMIDFVLYFLCYQYPHFSVTRYSTRRRQTVRMLAASDIDPEALMLLTLCPLVVLHWLIWSVVCIVLMSVPSAAPSAVRAVMVDNSTLRLSWKPLPHHAHNGPLLGYRVFQRFVTN